MRGERTCIEVESQGSVARSIDGFEAREAKGSEVGMNRRRGFVKHVRVEEDIHRVGNKLERD